jgi:glycosyltransferase involved in cell wall biosynthesis
MEKKQHETIEIDNIQPMDLVCFCHLRWDFVYQRPQHLMSRFAKRFRIFFIEEPLFHSYDDCYKIDYVENVSVIKIYLKEAPDNKLSLITRQKLLLNKLFSERKINKFIAWYYTPMALKISRHLKPEFIIYDCMDELSAFKFAPPELKILEAALFKKAQLVFTGGHNLYESKKQAHHNIYPFPSSIDKQHFMQARKNVQQPADQFNILPVRLGFYGVIDERFNIKLIEEVAKKRPEWQLILIGPVVKIDAADLPKQKNIHYLGSKSYKDLPSYLSGWDIAIIPFEKNESTKYISPTKTPEYLAAGIPVISTSIVDVVNPYGINNLVHIADTTDEFIAAAERQFNTSAKEYGEWLRRVDEFLADVSWDKTVEKMMAQVNACLLDTKAVKNTSEALKSVA